MDISDTKLLNSYFDFYYAKEIGLKMNSVFKEKCFGCQCCSLSQLDHSCVTLTKAQLLELYFEDVLREVDEEVILSNWLASASALDVSSELVDMFKLKLFCKDWRETDMKTPAWKTKMINMTIQILLLETRFN